MRIICTGTSGTDRMSWLRHVQSLAQQAGRDVALYDTRDVMFQIALDVGEPVDEETVLDMFPRALVLLRAAALENICSEMEARGASDWILNTHALFRWRHGLISGFDPHYLSRLNPDLFMTVTCGLRTLQHNLRQHDRWRPLGDEDALTWREEEQFFTEEMARIHRKPQLVVPRAVSPLDAFRLLFQAHVPRAYLSYPMQHAQPCAERDLEAFKSRLSRLAVVFDPASITDTATEPSSTPLPQADVPSPVDENSDAGQSQRLMQRIADQIVLRDYQLIAQSDYVVVYYDISVPSPGVISEMKFALESGKQVYGVWLPGVTPSVFFTRYCSTWFSDSDALFARLASHGTPTRAS